LAQVSFVFVALSLPGDPTKRHRLMTNEEREEEEVEEEEEEDDERMRWREKGQQVTGKIEKRFTSTQSHTHAHLRTLGEQKQNKNKRQTKR